METVILLLVGAAALIAIVLLMRKKTVDCGDCDGGSCRSCPSYNRGQQISLDEDKNTEETESRDGR